MRGTILAAVLLAAACGGKSSGPTGPSNTGGGGGGGGDPLPWEGALTVGAKFELVLDMESENDAPDVLTATVTAVENEGAARVYKLSWGEGEGANGPTSIRVEGGKVRINDADLAAMQEPWEGPNQGWCYAEDFSNPCGCEDVCDADLCFDATGITSVGGLYAPNYMPYKRR
jgi:hypothetical protein